MLIRICKTVLIVVLKPKSPQEINPFYVKVVFCFPFYFIFKGGLFSAKRKVSFRGLASSCMVVGKSQNNDM